MGTGVSGFAGAVVRAGGGLAIDVNAAGDSGFGLKLGIADGWFAVTVVGTGAGSGIEKGGGTGANGLFSVDEEFNAVAGFSGADGIDREGKPGVVSDKDEPLFELSSGSDGSGIAGVLSADESGIEGNSDLSVSSPPEEVGAAKSPRV